MVRLSSTTPLCPMASRRALTATQVSALKKHGVHWIAPSLYLQIRPQGTRSWRRHNRSENPSGAGGGISATKERAGLHPHREQQDQNLPKRW
jgi:hypothetical protein